MNNETRTVDLASDTTGDAHRSLTARRRSLYWRIHFWAALIASPFALIAALTGILYIFTPQIERALHGSLDRVASASEMRPLDDAVAAAIAATPADWSLRSVVPAHRANETVKVYFSTPSRNAAQAASQDGHGAHQHAPAAAMPTVAPTAGAGPEKVVVYVDPATAQVVGSQAESARFGNWARKLHSSLLQGEGWRWMIELAASWLMVMLVTGIALWWPRGADTAWPRTGARGRIAWKQWHGFLGVALSLITFTILATGLTWSKYAGEQVRSLRDHVGQAPPKAPRDLKSTVADGAPALTWQAAWDAARRHAPDVRMQLAARHAPQDPWRANSIDPGQPEKRFELLLDAYSGKALYYAGWERHTAFSKATGFGIPFHRGEFGWWNQALLLLFGLGVLFSIVSGWVMFFKRRRAGASMLPRLLPGAWKSASAGAWAMASVMIALMPLLALSAALVAAFEIAAYRMQRGVGRRIAME